MALSRAEVVAAFYAALGRAPESEAVLEEHRALGSVAALGTHLRASSEFLSSSARAFGASSEEAPYSPAADKLLEPALWVPVDVDAPMLQRLFTREQATWSALGENEPYWSVLSQEKYLKSNQTSTLEAEFDASGAISLERLLAALGRCREAPRRDARRSILAVVLGA